MSVRSNWFAQFGVFFFSLIFMYFNSLRAHAAIVAHMPPSFNYTSVEKKQGDTLVMQFVYPFLIVYRCGEVKICPNFSVEKQRRF